MVQHGRVFPPSRRRWRSVQALAQDRAFEGGAEHGGKVVGDERARYSNLDRAAVVVERPDASAPSAHSQACVSAQIFWALGPAAAGVVLGAADNDQGERLLQSHRDHVGGDELAQPYARVKSVGREVDQLLAGRNLHLDLGTRPAEGCDQRLQQDRAQQPGRPLSEFTCGCACGDKLFEGGPCARKKSLSRFGQADTARRAYEEGYPRRASSARTA